MSKADGKKRPLGKLRAASGMPGYDLSAVPKNANGGVLVTEEELATAFEFFDVDNTGKITMSNLRKRLGVFYKNMATKDYRFLMNNKQELTLEDLKDLLLDNEVTNFDPVAEAFKVYDPELTGYVDSEVLRNIFSSLGFGDITDEDLQILIETGDVDKDGKISLEDFRHMLESNREIAPTEPPPPEEDEDDEQDQEQTDPKAAEA